MRITLVIEDAKKSKEGRVAHLSVAAEGEQQAMECHQCARSAGLFAVVGSYDRLINMTAFAFLLFYSLTAKGFSWDLCTLRACAFIL